MTDRDEAVRTELVQALHDAPGLDPAEIDVQVHQGEATLSGRVGGPAEHHRALDTAASTPGVTQVEDLLRDTGERNPEGRR